VWRAYWGRIDPDRGSHRSTLSLGYGYRLSPRSELYGALMSDRVSGTGAGTGTGRSYSAGIRHRF
jgi:predicted porin